MVREDRDLQKVRQKQIFPGHKDEDTVANANLFGILAGENPRLIDEWQNAPDLWNAAKSEVDSREGKFGQFIFTGSSTPADKSDIYHSGAGRIVTLKMRPMSLAETKESKGLVSLAELFEGKKSVFGINEGHHLQDTAFYICRGGWPLSLVSDREDALEITQNYCSTLFDFENSKNGKFRNKKPEIFRLILRSYARHISTEARRQTIIDDVSEHEGRKLDGDTFEEYLQALKDLYILQDTEAWNPNFRSKTAVITSPTRHFVDTSIAAGALGLSPDDLLNDPGTFGLFFKDFAVKELSVYATNLKGEVSHYRDSNGLECDAVVHLQNGDYALIEVKIGGEEEIAYGARRLKCLRERIRENGQKELSFSMILTAAGDAQTTGDGVHVVPINMLKA